jgi:hypothetical protein
MVVNGRNWLAAVATDSQLVRNGLNVKEDKTLSKREINTELEKAILPDLSRASTHRPALMVEPLSSLMTGALALDTSQAQRRAQ